MLYLLQYPSMLKYARNLLIMDNMRLGKYKHYKGKEYKVIGVAVHSETREDLVIYIALYDDKKYGKNSLWARPKGMFLEEVEVDGKKISRFEYIVE